VLADEKDWLMLLDEPDLESARSFHRDATRSAADRGHPGSTQSPFAIQRRPFL
jgi:hypothetical protein